MKRLFSLLFLCFSFLSICSQNESSIKFVIKNLGINVDGHFNTYSIKMNFNSDGTLTNITGTIEVLPIKTGIESRDEHLLEEDYFNANTHKYIRFQSTSITKKSDNRDAVIADLSIKGITKEISIVVTVSKTSEGDKITSNFEINRKDFKVGGSTFVMRKTVKVNIDHDQSL